MEVTQKFGLAFNPKKTHVKVPTVRVIRYLYDQNGIHPDLEKVDVHCLPTPTNISELHEFLVMVAYLSPSMPSMFTWTAPPHELLKKLLTSIGKTLVK